MKKIKLTQGKMTIIDHKDLKIVNQYKWYFMGCGYAATRPWNKETKTYSTIYLHRFLMGNPKNQVDHINQNKLDNRRKNLRLCSHADNARNSKHRANNTTGFRGVSTHYDGKKFAASITINYKKIHLGLFKTKEAASKSYKAAAKKYFGVFASE